MCSYKIAMHIFSVCLCLKAVCKFMNRTDTLYILLCICTQQEKEENVKNFLKYWIIIFLFGRIVFSFLSPTCFTGTLIFQSDFSNGTMCFCFFFYYFWTSLKCETESSHTYAWPIWWWWFILLCEEGVKMFWKGWSCIVIQNTGVKEIQQLSCSFLPEL